MLAIGMDSESNKNKSFEVFPVIVQLVAMVILIYVDESVLPQSNIMMNVLSIFILMVIIFLLGLAVVNTWAPTAQIGVDAKALAASIEHDSCWVAIYCRLQNQRTGAELWIANGERFIDYYPNVKAFNEIEKAEIYRAVKIRLAKNAILPKGE